MSSPIWFSIPEFTGIQQQKDGRLLPITSAYDARNMETSNGNLSVAKGFSKAIDSAIPGEGTLLKLIPVDTSWTPFYVVASNTIYMWDTEHDVWSTLLDNDHWYGGSPVDLVFSPEIDAIQVDSLHARIGSDDVILVCTGDRQAYVIYDSPNNHGYARKFGSGLYSFEGTVYSYNSGTRKLTANTYVPDDARRRASLYGITYGSGIRADVSDVGVDGNDRTFFILSETPTTPPAVSDALKISGGSGSDAHIAYAKMYANRLFAAGDPSNPCRLYWSAVPGDGRTIEDWGIVDGSEDASGGYVEVGEAHYDPIIGLTALSNQLLIWKKYSVWRLFGDRPSTFTLERVERDSDYVSNAGVLVYHDAPYFLTRRCIKTYDGVGVVPVESANQLKRFFEAEAPIANNSRAALCNNRMYMSCYMPSAGEYENSLVVFNLSTGSYMIRDGFSFADIAALGDDLFVLTSQRTVCQFDDSNTYDGTPFLAWWETQLIDFGRKMNKHQIMALYMQLAHGDVKVVVTGDHEGACCERVVHWPHVDGEDEDYDRPIGGYVTARIQADQSHLFSIRFENVEEETEDEEPTTRSMFSINGGVNIKFLSELKE